MFDPEFFMGVYETVDTGTNGKVSGTHLSGLFVEQLDVIWYIQPFSSIHIGVFCCGVAILFNACFFFYALIQPVHVAAASCRQSVMQTIMQTQMFSYCFYKQHNQTCIYFIFVPF